MNQPQNLARDVSGTVLNESISYVSIYTRTISRLVLIRERIQPVLTEFNGPSQDVRHHWWIESITNQKVIRYVIRLTAGDHGRIFQSYRWIGTSVASHFAH